MMKGGKWTIVPAYVQEKEKDEDDDDEEEEEEEEKEEYNDEVNSLWGVQEKNFGVEEAKVGSIYYQQVSKKYEIEIFLMNMEYVGKIDLALTGRE